LYQDVWNRNKDIAQQRILANLGIFEKIFARKCDIISGRNNEKVRGEINKFLEKYHSYGDAKCKYKYAMYYNNRIVAVAGFSHGREMPRNINNSFEYLPKGLNPNLKECKFAEYEKIKDNIVMFKSFEWVRYTSLPNIRVIGGMGKFLKHFIKDILDEFLYINHYEIMSYSDNEWGSGNVYKTLNFKYIGKRTAVEYCIDKTTNKRVDKKYIPNCSKNNYYTIKNQGSAKYLLQFIRTPHCSSLYSILT
jgi:hypothetical protein